METIVEYPCVQESVDEDPESSRNEGVVGGGPKVWGAHLYHLVHCRGCPRYSSRSLT